MPAGSFTVFDHAKTRMLDGTHDLDTHSFRMILCSNAVSFTSAFAGTSTNCQYSDITSELATAGGYTSGGKTLTCTLTRSGANTTFDCDDQSWTGATFTAKWAVIYNNNPAVKNLIGFTDLETSNSTGLSPSAGTLNVNINAAGLFVLS